MSLNKNNIIPFFALLLLQALAGQERTSREIDSFPTQNLEEVVITATRTYRQLSSVPMPVTLVSRKQIARTGVTRLSEILAEQTGIVLTPDATIGGGEGVQIQGIASDYVLILIDGVPVVGRSSGNLDLSRLAVGNIAQVEVVKGPASSLFGSEALGGVINIITEDPASESLRLRVSHRAATFNNQNSRINLGQRLGKISYNLFVDRMESDGYDLTPSDPNQTVQPFQNYTVTARARSTPLEALNLLASARFFVQDFDLPSGSSEETDVNALLRATLTPAKQGEWQWEAYFTRYTTNERSGKDAANFLENSFDQRLFRPEMRYHFPFASGSEFTAGAGYAFEYLERNLFAEDVSFRSQYVYGQFDFRPLPKLNLIVGARWDHHSEFASQLSPKLSGKFDLSEFLSLKASVGSGFKAPDFRQLYLDFTNASGGGYAVLGKTVEASGIERFRANGELAGLLVPESELGTPLKAERSVGINLGLRWQKGFFSSEVNLFRNDFRNLIDTRILATRTNGQSVFGYINRDRVYTQGAEADVSVRLPSGWEFQAGYQLLYAYDKDKQDALNQGAVFARDPQTNQAIRLSNAQYFGLENRSRHTLNLKVFYEIPQWGAFANLRLNYRSRFGLSDRNGNDLLDAYDASFVQGYALVNLALGKTLFQNFELQLGANNLLDYRGSNPLGPQDARVWIHPGIQFFTRLTLEL